MHKVNQLISKKTLRKLLGFMSVSLAVILVVGVAGLVVSPLTGWGWMPTKVLAQLPLFPNLQPDPVEPLASLTLATIPEPSNLSEFVRDRAAAVKLGKALFWDMQVGSDGGQACASCHFAAGADTRSNNQISPGLLGGDTTFNTGGPNSQLQVSDFPFHRLSDPGNRLSTVTSDSNDVVSSQGVPFTTFVDIVPGSAEDLGNILADPVFSIGGTNVRRVEPRNTPTVINAVFNFDNFWDGRARNVFNGVNPFGDIDQDAFVLRAVNPTQIPEEVRVALDNSSLASQAVGPPLSPFEMSFDGRTFPKLGKKMLSLTPLGKQLVHPEDSVLASLSRSPDNGLSTSYEEMIQAAFQPQWWDSEFIITEDANGNLTFTDPAVLQPSGRALTTDEFTLMDRNFSLFFGLAVQMYESTLISDDSPFDRMMQGDRDALTEEQRRGLGVFEGQGNCIECHSGPEFTDASVRHVSNEILEQMNMGDGECAIYDNGMYNIGVRPTGEDLGRGGTDPFGNPLSHTRRAQLGLFVDNSKEGVPEIDPERECHNRAAVDGAFKVSGLRNVELTAPYFHNGGQLTLRQVVEFYNRGGDFFEQNIDNVDVDIEELDLDEEDINQLVAFLKSLTDERVRFEQAPFDHPQLFVPNGHPVTSGPKAQDALLEIPAVGRNGGAPIPSFLGTAPPPTPPPAQPTPTPPPESPSEGVSCTTPVGLQGTLDVSWVAHPNPDVIGYNVHRSLVSGGPFEKVNAELITVTTFRDTGLPSDTTFHYTITAVDRFGNASPKSGEVSGTTLP